MSWKLDGISSLRVHLQWCQNFVCFGVSYDLSRYIYFRPGGIFCPLSGSHLFRAVSRLGVFFLTEKSGMFV